MAPPKTMIAPNVNAIASGEAKQQQQAIKARKRKNQTAKQQQQVPLKETTNQQKPAANSAAQKQADAKQQLVVPSARSAPAKRQQVAPIRDISISQEVAHDVQQARQAVVAKQLSSEEADDIDAGIELDGSSNSGSSVKDLCEEQIKSASVSPVMAQVSNSKPNDSIVAPEKSADVKLVKVDEVAVNSVVSEDTKKTSTAATKAKQLAANQQVIDADEQQLQAKLKKKQDTSSEENQKAPLKQNSIDKAPPLRRRFSSNSQSSQEAQDGSFCKVCQQHVYQMERMLAEKSVYHKRCFRCYQCKIQLRVDNYSSHEGQVYCKAHHRQIFQPQVKLDNEEDVDIVAKSNAKPVDDYLLHRGRLSELSFSFLNQNSEGIRQRQMIICENEPAELPKDVVRSDTKVDDGIEQLNLNLGNILEKFERGTASNGEESQPSSAGVVIEKPSFNIKQTLMAFESRLAPADEPADKMASAERPIVKKLTNLSGFLNRQNSQDSDSSSPVVASPQRSLPMRRSESLMMRLKKYESRIAGEQVEDDEDEDDVEDGRRTSDLSESENDDQQQGNKRSKRQESRTKLPKKLTSINLSSLKNQWENGDIKNRRDDEEEEEGNDVNREKKGNELSGAKLAAATIAKRTSAGDNIINSSAQMTNIAADKEEELIRIRQQLARKKVGGGSVRNIYENAIKEAQLQQQQASLKRDSSDLSALNGFSTTEIQQQLLQQVSSSNNTTNGILTTSSLNNNENQQTPTTPNSNKDHFQLNFSNKANKLKEKFELGLINNSSRDDSDLSDEDGAPVLSKLEQIRQEKLEDLSVFTDGEIKAREARSLFQQIDRKISAANGGGAKPALVNSRSLASIGASMRAKLTSQMNANGTGANNNVNDTNNNNNTHHNHNQQLEKPQPIRLTNNVRT